MSVTSGTGRSDGDYPAEEDYGKCEICGSPLNLVTDSEGSHTTCSNRHCKSKVFEAIAESHLPSVQRTILIYAISILAALIVGAIILLFTGGYIR